MHVKQAMGLRTTAYKGLAWWKFQGKEAESQAASEALERDVAEFLVTNGVSFETQEQQVARQASDDLHSPTPDYLIHSSLFINDQRVNWIEVTILRCRHHQRASRLDAHHQDSKADSEIHVSVWPRRRGHPQVWLL